MSSRAFARTTIACTITPEIRASGRNVLARARISAVALRTASALVRLSTTPPTSDLCTMSRDMILRTTVEPCAKIAFAWATASSASAAAKVGTTAMS